MSKGNNKIYWNAKICNNESKAWIKICHVQSTKQEEWNFWVVRWAFAVLQNEEGESKEGDMRKIVGEGLF